MMNTPEFIAENMDCRMISKDIAMNHGALWACRRLGELLRSGLSPEKALANLRIELEERNKVMKQALDIHKCKVCPKIEREYEIVYPIDL